MSPWPRAMRALRRLAYGPRVKVVPHGQMMTLGSAYGGWTFAVTDNLVGATIISCGLGEDASFDSEFAAMFQARVVIVDPTPRAIEHFELLSSRLGLPRTRGYASGGSQAVESYDLSDIPPDRLVLLPKAVTDSVGKVRFYAPTNPADVSHSVVNFQNDYSDSTPFIEVESVDFPGVLEFAGTSDVALVKFDIEGAEIEVIPQMIAAGITPSQILVEFDELGRPSARARRNFDLVHGLLLKAGYAPIHFDRRSCVSYLLRAAV